MRTGLDLLPTYAHRLRGKKLGIIAHQASVNSSLQHIISVLMSTRVDIAAIFGPEHGLWGTAQDQIEVEAEASPLRGIQLYSLYGDQRYPRPEWLKDIDILICDLQDVGSRYYTFVWTMALAMQACARQRKRFMVLDRPNPLNGNTLEGPVLDMAFASFVGLYPVPVRHGMTIGELALWLNETFQIGADLEVIRMQGWKRAMSFEDTGLPWVLPSPNMPTLDTARVYPGQCLFEGTTLSEGRGTTRPFEIIGAPYIDPDHLADSLHSLRLPGIAFRPCRFEPTFHKYQGQSCGGVQLHVTDVKTFKPFYTGISLINLIAHLYPRKFRWRPPPYEYEMEKLPFDILCGTDQIRQAIEAGHSLKVMEKNWENQIEDFQRQRKPFLLYN